MMRLAQLAMYDVPEVRAANDALWRAVAVRLREDGLRDVPQGVARDLALHDGWRHPRLLLAQSCGYAALRDFPDHLRIIAAPIYDAPGCVGTTHTSFFIVPAGAAARRLEDLRGLRFAMNSRDSNTGANLPRLALAPLAQGRPFFGAVVETGSHARSFALVAAGAADAAAIDCVSHALLVRRRPALAAATRILAATAPSPTLPFVTARSSDARTIARLRRALAHAMTDAGLAASRRALLLVGLMPAAEADYAVLHDHEATARRLGYPELA